MGAMPWEKYAASSDSGQMPWEKYGVAPASTSPTPAPDTRNAVQKAFDNLTTVTPEQEQGHSWLTNKAQEFGAGAIQGVSAPFVHPEQTLAGLGNTVLHPVNTVEALAKSAMQHPAQTLGNVAGGAVMGAGLEAGAASDTASAARAALAERTAPIVESVKSTASKLVPSLVDGPSESLMTRAIKPGKNNINWNADVQKAIPLMKSAEQQLGHPVQGVDDALQAANLAKQNIWQQYQARLGPAGQMGATIDGNQIADAMVNNVDRRTALQNPQLVKRVETIADTYRRPLSVNEAEDFLQSANKDLNSYYAKNKVGQQVAENDPEISSTVAEASALRNALYSKLEQVSGPGATQLKQAYGSLTNIEKELYGRQLVAARQNPESLSEQLSTVRGAGKIIKGVATLDPGDILEGTQNITVSRALKARNSSDAMIARAFQAAKPATPFPMPANPQIAGLLQRGAIPMGAPESSGSPLSMPPHNPQYYGPAISQGRLLPAQTGAPIELPYVPEMSGGERLAALMQYLRKNPQKALPAKASLIQLPPID